MQTPNTINENAVDRRPLTAIGEPSTPYDGRPANMLALLASEAIAALDRRTRYCVERDIFIFVQLAEFSSPRMGGPGGETIDQQLLSVPCDPALLRPIVERIDPARFGFAQRRWFEIKGSIRRMQRLTGWITDH